MYPLLGDPSSAGSVVAVWPAIGMVDVQFPHGVSRYPVEDLVVDSTGTVGDASGPGEGAVPGGVPVAVAGGPPRAYPTAAARVASRHLEALYWASRNRRYRATREEIESGEFCCPRCKKGVLRRTTYRHQDGKSERLWGCPRCMFLVCVEDLILGGG